MTEFIASPAFWSSLVTLTFLEIILGIDNLLFVSIAIEGLKDREQERARRVGVWGAMALRILMLSGIFWIIGLDKLPLFTLPDGLVAILGEDDHTREAFQNVTLKDVILFFGGLFLLWKGTREIHDVVENEHDTEPTRSKFATVVIQLLTINVVFSLDSVITAVGLTDRLPVMVLAIVLSTAVMAFAAEPLGDFIKRHPTTKMLALAFILLIGVALVADGAGFHIPRGYLYFAIAFSLFVEMLNISARRKRPATKPI